MPTPCWLKHLCSIRALVPVSFFLSVCLLSLSLYFWLIPWSAEARWAHLLIPWSAEARSAHFLARALEKVHCAFTHSRGRPVPTCSSVSPKNRTLLAFRVNQGISASFSLLLSYHWLRTTRFWSIKGPTDLQRVCIQLNDFKKKKNNINIYTHTHTSYFNLAVLL